MNNQVAFFKYMSGFTALDGDTGYLAGYQPDWLSYLTTSGMWSNEVNVINQYIEKYKGTTKDLVDIGANEGTYTFGLGKVFNHVFAFEPSKHIYNILCGNIAIHGMSDMVDTYNTGLYSEDRVLDYVETSMNGGCNYFNIKDIQTRTIDGVHSELRVRTLDSYELDNVGLIKIDVEGAELEVLKGAVNTIKQNNYPEILFESWDPAQQVLRGMGDYQELYDLRSNLFDFLESLGYNIFCIDKERDIYNAVR